MYYPAKIALLVMMVNPSTEVKDKLYRRIVLPFVERHRARIDATLARGNSKVRELWAVVWAYTLKFLRKMLSAVWFSAAAQPPAGGGEAQAAALAVAVAGKQRTAAATSGDARQEEATPAPTSSA